MDPRLFKNLARVACALPLAFAPSFATPVLAGGMHHRQTVYVPVQAVQAAPVAAAPVTYYQAAPVAAAPVTYYQAAPVAAAPVTYYQAAPVAAAPVSYQFVTVQAAPAAAAPVAKAPTAAAPVAAPGYYILQYQPASTAAAPKPTMKSPAAAVALSPTDDCTLSPSIQSAILAALRDWLNGYDDASKPKDEELRGYVTDRVRTLYQQYTNVAFADFQPSDTKCVDALVAQFLKAAPAADPDKPDDPDKQTQPAANGTQMMMVPTAATAAAPQLFLPVQVKPRWLCPPWMK